MTKGLGPDEIDKEAEEIAQEQRRLIESVVIRRSRLDLKQSRDTAKTWNVSTLISLKWLGQY